MPLTVNDIHNKEFSRGFRGYDEDEVNEFLDQIIQEYGKVIQEKKDLESKVSDLMNRLGHFSNIEETLTKSIVVAQDAAEELKRNAQKEAKLIVKEAEKNADRIVSESLAKARKITVEIEELKKQSKVFQTRFKMLIEAQLDLLNNNDWDQLMQYEVELESFMPMEQEEENFSQKLDKAF